MMESKLNLSKRVLNTEAPIMQIMKDLSAGMDVISLSQGVPFFGPPDGLLKFVNEREGIDRYGPDGGDPELKEAIAVKLKQKNGIEADPEHGLMVTSGANLGFFNAAASICDPGDEMVLIGPYYFNHRMTLDVLGVNFTVSRADDGHIPLPDDISSSISERTRAVVLVSPNNPTGMSYPKSVVSEIIDICVDNDLWLISDETYEDFTYENDHFSPGSEGGDLPVVSLFSLSKSYGISGWRVGYAAYPEILHESMLKVQDTTVICPSRVSQSAALFCIREHPGHTARFIPYLDRNRSMLIDWKRRLPQLSGPNPDGAYYSLLGYVGERPFETSMDLARSILEMTGVLVVPSSPFGLEDPPSFRMAYGNVGNEELREALERLDEFFQD
ncbi:MAG: aminotransferase class I/II-fold pyridoxal phosphate-dependent enzyme [Thermoplasmatota archaeon]